MTHKDIDGLADKTFPLCMQILHKNLSNSSHLKHFGRLQYGLFLKGIGLSLDESILFWKNKFKNITHDKFEKEYSYNIRHSYGKEGKRNDYIPWSCTRIQKLQTPSASEHHGCPYQVYSEDKLKSVLFDLKFKELDVLKILEKKRNNEYSVKLF
jgi:DNA primase large subunit